jgi:hypothetical protein
VAAEPAPPRWPSDNLHRLRVPPRGMDDCFEDLRGAGFQPAAVRYLHRFRVSPRSCPTAPRIAGSRFASRGCSRKTGTGTVFRRTTLLHRPTCARYACLSPLFGPICGTRLPLRQEPRQHRWNGLRDGHGRTLTRVNYDALRSEHMAAAEKPQSTCIRTPMVGPSAAQCASRQAPIPKQSFLPEGRGKPAPFQKSGLPATFVVNDPG